MLHTPQFTKGLRPSRPRHASSALRLWPAPTLRVVSRRASSQQPSESDAGPSTSNTDDLPPELQGLQINEDGFLIDTKTGKVINEMGATRFDVAVRALRGELDPPEWVENSERTPGVILSALYQFPRSYLFQVVGRPTASPAATSATSTASSTASTASSSVPAAAPGLQPACCGGGDGASGGKAAFVADVTSLIARVVQAEVEEGKVEVKERLGGKYVSVAVEVVVRAPELVGMVYDELAKDPRVIMKF
ncbi:hypothetical protein PLESTB_000987000 [Pleodorina starrii]|uniref:Uncharacterized protein n=1 Tax=Pleodorina starrii TaxID=330485 RepID=A0A9W6BNC9_9CHLO|nr:hypothetical protein PLESTM_000549600 [Pleodorina starrii]GLC55436.1 hypothetical protein PLESTB_000987000 [Pleodorina starrii]GLC73829.1 hypothetical protein PLESTF_001425400 [Pleodorina starrii]